MERTEFRSSALPCATRWSAWKGSLSRFAVETDPLAPGGAADGQIRTFAASSGLSFTLVESQAPQLLSAAPGAVAEVFWLALILSGQSVLDLGGAPIPMTAGDMLYGKRGTPSALRISTGFRMLLVNIPAALVTRKTLLPLPSQAIYVPGRSGPGRILSGLLGAVAESLEELDEIQTGSIEAALAPFLLSALFSDEARRPLGGAAAVRRGALQRLWRAIEDSLCDPGFSLARLSAAQGLSARYVQKLFEETGESFSRYLRRRRLEQCRADLANPLNARISITTTCFHWGFNDPASFSRAFREEFGLSPRAYRRQALLSSTGSLPQVAADLGSSSPGLQS